MSRLNTILTEAEITDKITSRAPITFGALVDAVLDHEDEKINNSNMNDFLKKLDIKSKQTLEQYIERAKKAKFLNDDGTVPNRYTKSRKGRIKSGGKFDQALDSRIRKFKAPKVNNNNLYEKQVSKMLSMMVGQASTSGVKNSLMLTGDPGVGKTSFIRNFSKLLGLPLITVEAPHITEEHIINIPFMIINDKKVKKESAIIETEGSMEDGQEFNIVQSESNLVTKLKKMRNYKFKDKQLKQKIAKDKNLRMIYLNYKRLVDQVRDSYHCILFLDEYYRNDNIKIRNILRNILNGRIGNDKIPKGTFIVYASNLDDDGLTEIALNNDFQPMQFDAPDREQWFQYILNKYNEDGDGGSEDHKGIKMNPKVFNKFYETVDQEELSMEDEDSEVRSSPRRWEQLLIYVNANLPVANVREAKILMSNFEVNFRNYAEAEVSNIFPKYKKMLVELIEETSGIKFDGSKIEDAEWKEVFQQQIETKIKIDGEKQDTESEDRKYVPIISGEPGIGKTSHMRQVADDLDLHFISIDTSTLTRESTTGIPTAKQETDENGEPLYDQNGDPVMTTEFSKPELLDLIQKQIQEELDEDSIYPPEERKKGKGKFKHLLLFDELTRADPQVFNSIRKLLLEKSFNEDFDLPDDVMVVGAMNPEDEGVGELTKHTRDVLDIIPSKASWKKTESYLLSTERPEGLEEALGFDLNESTVSALKMVLNQYKTREEDFRGNPVSKDEKMFNLQDQGNIIYISPREITDLVAMTNTNILNKLTKNGISVDMEVEQDTSINELDDEEFLAMLEEEEKDTKSELASKGIFDPTIQYSEEDFDAFLDAIIVEFRDVWASKITFICRKQDIEPANVLSVTTGFIMKDPNIRAKFEGIKSLKIKDTKTIDELFDAYFDDPDELYDSPHFDNYLEANISAPQKFTQEINDFISDKLVEIEKISGSGKTIEYETKAGELNEIPVQVDKKLDLYLKMIKYIKNIFKILSEKIEFSEGNKGQKTGQYINNLYIELQSMAKDFLRNHKLQTYLIGDNAHINAMKALTAEVNETKKHLKDLGIESKHIK